MGAFPRTLLLTWWPPTLKYAGGEFVRRLVGVLPAGQVKWACLSPLSGAAPVAACECQAFVPPQLHWRLRKTRIGAAAGLELAGRSVVRRIAEWVKPWQPQVLWVLPELAAVGVATHLRVLLGIPVHLTLHDVFESAGFSEVPAWYVPRYVRRANALVRDAASMDGISDELITYVASRAIGAGQAAARGRTAPVLKTVVFPPSISGAVIAGEPPRHADDGCFRLALCGSMRTGTEQWLRFVKGLTAAFGNVEMVAVGDARRQAELARPSGVRIVHHDYFTSEEELVAFLQASRADAGYAGVWEGEDRRLFTTTSFSSKITVYAAAGIPTIFDGPSDSAAWKVLRRWNAGILWQDTPVSVVEPSLSDSVGEENTPNLLSRHSRNQNDSKILTTDDTDRQPPNLIRATRGSNDCHLAMDSTREGLRDLKDPVQWQAMADGALALCRQELSLERNARKFREVLSAVAQGS